MPLHAPKPCSILSIDVGRRRIGLAGCDQLGITVSCLPALKRQTFVEDIEVLKAHCQTRKVEGIVIGLPLDENGLITEQAKFCKRYGEKIANSLDLPIAWVNEHSSTWAAENRYNLRGDRSGQLDSASAALLLEQWLREGPELKPVRLASPSLNKVDRNDGSLKT